MALQTLSGLDVLQQALQKSRPIADGDYLADSVQDAVDTASDWVWVPPGTYTENVTVSTAGLSLTGAGYHTLIDGGTNGHAITVDANDVTVANLSVQTTSGSGNNHAGVFQSANAPSNVTIENVTIRECAWISVRAGNGGSGWTIRNCYNITSDYHFTSIYNCSRTIVTGNVIEDNGADAIAPYADDMVVANNVIVSSAEDGFNADGNDIILIGNQVVSAGQDGILLASGATDAIVANNRVPNIVDNGTSNTLDANVTGARN